LRLDEGVAVTVELARGLGVPLPGQRESLRGSVRYWAAQNGYGQAVAGKAA
jgi:hypothetical protein